MRKEERNRGSVRVKLIWGTGNGENLSGCTVDPWLQLNWTQETGPLGRGRGGGEREGGRQEGRIRACASEEENFNWRQFVESPGGWNPPGSSRLLNFTRMTTLYTVTPPSSPRFETFHPSFTFHQFFLLFSPRLLSLFSLLPRGAKRCVFYVLNIIC